MRVIPAYVHYVSLVGELSRVITPLLAVFKLVLFMIVPSDLPDASTLLCVSCRSEVAFHYNVR